MLYVLQIHTLDWRKIVKKKNYSLKVINFQLVSPTMGAWPHLYVFK